MIHDCAVDFLVVLGVLVVLGAVGLCFLDKVLDE